MKGGALWLAARSPARAARRCRTARCSGGDDALVARRHHRRRRARLRRRDSSSRCDRRLARRDHRPLRRARRAEVGVGEAIMATPSSRSARSAAASGSTRSRCRATGRRRTSSRSTRFTAAHAHDAPPRSTPDPDLSRDGGPRSPSARSRCCDDALLLVRRGRGPAAGEWSVPGGHVERGRDAARGRRARGRSRRPALEVVVDRFLGWVERMASRRLRTTS